MIYHGDCLEIMPTLADKSVDMILCDLPYGTTACKWDTVIPFEPLWKQYKRLIKDNGAIVLTASQPFTSALVMSNPGWFRYELIWNKVHGKAPGVAKYRPLPAHEAILIFGNSGNVYNPQMGIGKPFHRHTKERLHSNGNEHQLGYKVDVETQNNGTRYPISVITIPAVNHLGQHPTQKPVALFEYLIRTYTNDGDTVLDNCAGSFTTAIACINTNRNYICIEKDEKYFEIGKNRIENHQPLFRYSRTANGGG